MSETDDLEPIGEEHYSLEVEQLHPEIERRAFASGGYPYDKKLKNKEYLEQLRLLQIELLKLQEWQRESGARVVMVFEGRDTAGKGGTI